jgi:hypothetical protein
MTKMTSFHEDVEALVAAMGQLLYDMRQDGTSVSLPSKAQARIAYQAFAAPEEIGALMDIDEARRVLRSLEGWEPGGARTPPGLKLVVSSDGHGASGKADGGVAVADEPGKAPGVDDDMTAGGVVRPLRGIAGDDPRGFGFERCDRSPWNTWDDR